MKNVISFTVEKTVYPEKMNIKNNRNRLISWFSTDTYTLSFRKRTIMRRTLLKTYFGASLDYNKACPIIGQKWYRLFNYSNYESFELRGFLRTFLRYLGLTFLY